MGIQINDHENTNSRSGTEEQETHVAAAGRQRAVAVLGRVGQEQRPLGGGLTPLLPSPLVRRPYLPQATTNGLLIGLQLPVVSRAS